MPQPTSPGNIDRARLRSLLTRLLELNKAGAEQRSHKDFYDREGILDEMQQMLGLGMVMVTDIIKKANQVLAT
jgi:hypothetical protein